MGKRIYEKHGDTGTRLHSIWKGMICRCYSKNWVQYKNYGERGIKVFEEWRNSYSSFKVWSLNNGYDKNLELERKNVNGDYNPLNCEWITHSEQTKNRRDTLYVKWDNNKMKLIDFIKKFNLNKNTANARRYENKLEDYIEKYTELKVEILGGKK